MGHNAQNLAQLYKKGWNIKKGEYYIKKGEIF